MKKSVFVLTTLFASCIALPIQVADYNEVATAVIQTKVKDKHAIMVQNKMHMMAAIMTGEEMIKNNPKTVFEIVLIGNVVKDIAVDQDLKNAMAEANKAGILFVSCEFAMNKLGVTKDQYLSFVRTTPNAFIYLFDLQDKGYKNLIL